MATKKKIKPLFDVKHDFIDSLDAFIDAVNMLYMAVDAAIDLDQIKAPASAMIKQRLDNLNAAMQSTEINW